MQLLLVEKDSRLTSTYVERVLAFDRDARTVYLSDCNYSSRGSGGGGKHVASWKKSMRLYAVRLHCMYNSSVDMRSSTCDVRDLLTFTLYGAREHSVQQQQQAHGGGGHSHRGTPAMTASSPLPDLRAFAPNSTPHAGRYVDGSEAHTPTREPANAKDDDAFVSRECTWRLRGVSYGDVRDMYLRMRDALVADGLHAPVRGGFVGGVDPRNGLRFASLPLYLLRGLYCMRDALQYTCVHGELVGCNEHGALVVLVKHAYLCVTDEWVLVMTEDGKAVRWQPLQQLEAVEYCLHEQGQPPQPQQLHSSNSAGGDGDGARRAAASTLVALLAAGDAPDVVFHVTNTFAQNATAPSLLAALPRGDVVGAVTCVLDVLRVLRQSCSDEGGDRGTDDHAAALRVVCVSALSSAEDATTTATTTTASTTATRPPITTVRGYVERFAQTHARALKWQPLPGYASTHATLRSAAALAHALHVPQPQRQAVTHHTAFAPYYDEQPPASGDVAVISNSGSGSGGGGGNNNSTGGNDQSTSGVSSSGSGGAYAARPPKKKLSRLLHSLYPNEAMY